MMKKKRILVYGDSNSWGWMPQEEIVPTARDALEKTWPYMMAARLGDDYEVVVDALSGRTTCIDDPAAVISGAGLNGETYLPAVQGSHFPLDLVIILGGERYQSAL